MILPKDAHVDAINKAAVLALDSVRGKGPKALQEALGSVVPVLELMIDRDLTARERDEVADFISLYDAPRRRLSRARVLKSFKRDLADAELFFSKPCWDLDDACDVAIGTFITGMVEAGHTHKDATEKAIGSDALERVLARRLGRRLTDWEKDTLHSRV